MNNALSHEGFLLLYTIYSRLLVSFCHEPNAPS